MKNIIEVIKKRKSIRTYDNVPLNNQIQEQIEAYINKLSNPWGVKLRYTLVDSQSKERTEKLGTYGVIRNASSFIVVTLTDEEFALEALGYELEELMLYLTSLGIGTCWLGGTFTRGEFAKAVELGAGEIIPVITPIGYPAKNKSLTDKMMRKMSKGDSRKDWDKLFFLKDFDTILTIEEAGKYTEALEMIRLAPSASNKQPWRIVKEGNIFHFFEYSTPGYSKAFSYDIQRIDIGIAAVHFQLTVNEKDLEGKFSVLENKIATPENIQYKFSWIGETGEEVGTELGMDKIEGSTEILKEIYLAGGCFWGTDKYLSLIKGVNSTEVGYANGNTKNPTYQDVCYHNTGHTEAVKLVYDPSIINLDSILKLFYEVINPVTINKQGNDVGSQYRSGVYYIDENDKEVILSSIKELQEKYTEKIAVEVLPLNNYTTAEEYHQKYLDKNPGGYCHIGPSQFDRVKDMNK